MASGEVGGGLNFAQFIDFSGIGDILCTTIFLNLKIQ